MHKINRLAVLLGILLIFVSSASAVPQLLVDIQPVEDEISYSGIAKYNLELTNNRDEKMSINIPTPKNKWDITINPYLLEIAPHQSATVSVSVSPPQVIDSGIYSVYFEFREDGKVLDYRYLHVTVLEESPVVDARIKLIDNVEATETWAEGFLKTTYTAVLKNIGQTAASGRWEAEIHTYDQFFLTSDASLEKGEETVKLSWEYSLSPGEEVIYTYSVSYVPLLAAAIALAAALVLLGAYYSSRYRLIKSVSKKRGGFIYVELAVKNKTRKKQKNITVEDYVPVPLMLSREFGTMSPTAIRKSRDKLVLTWKFDELEPKEERMLSYKMKSKLEVEGKIIIPAAAAFQKTRKKVIQVYSKIRKG